MRSASPVSLQLLFIVRIHTDYELRSSMKNLLKKTDSKSSDSDPNRNALFGNRAKTAPPPQDPRSRPNPYAQQRNASYQDPNPYRSNNDPYASRGYDQILVARLLLQEGIPTNPKIPLE